MWCRTPQILKPWNLNPDTRLLEDPKKGVVLQGVEERPVNSAKDIYDILQGTNKQRRTAETLCNKQSSRSHSIFTLRIFMKDR
jgi:kinesin family protein 11